MDTRQGCCRSSPRLASRPQMPAASVASGSRTAPPPARSSCPACSAVPAARRWRPCPGTASRSHCRFPGHKRPILSPMLPSRWETPWPLACASAGLPGDPLTVALANDPAFPSHVRIQRVVLEHHGDVAPLGRHAVDHAPADGNLAAVDLLQPGHPAQQRAFAAARGADEHGEGTVRDLDADALQHGGRAERLCHAADRDGGRGRIGFLGVASPGHHWKPKQAFVACAPAANPTGFRENACLGSLKTHHFSCCACSKAPLSPRTRSAE